MDGVPPAPAGDPAARWCVLRMAGPRTLAVVSSLSEAGFSVWTPSCMVAPRKAGSKARHDPRPAPIVPTFAFAPYADVAELLRLRRDPASPHPAFSLLHHHHRAVELRDGDLDGLRRVQDQKNGSAKRQRPDGLPAGTEVRPSEGPFGGMSGIVTSSDGRRTFLDFGGFLGKVEIGTSQALADAVPAASSMPGSAPASAALAA